MPPIFHANHPVNAPRVSPASGSWTQWAPASADCSCPPHLRPWLTDAGSLTARLQACCRQLTVQVIHEGWGNIDPDRATDMQPSFGAPSWNRLVILRADGVPVVLAHSITDAHHIHGVWHELPTLGNRPLGALLFAAPDVQRSPLSVARLPDEHPLVGWARAVTGGSTEDALWARRSVFRRASAPLQVTEVFLPAMVRLAHPTATEVPQP